MDWQAQWIWNAGEASPRNEWWCFRTTFEAPTTGWDGAELAITADSRYVLYVNGTLVGRGPVRSWPFEQSYDTYDVRCLLRPGRANAIAVLVLHFGVPTFYYLRGRGGLLAQLNLTGGEQPVRTVASDASWRTARHRGQDERSPRMSYMQAFAERIDARAWNEAWVEPDYDDRSWSPATVIGPVGMAPWTELAPRDIPFLSEETVWPARVAALHAVESIPWSTWIDVRNAMSPESAYHANHVDVVGYVATIVRVPRKTSVVLGFPSAMDTLFGPCTINGTRYAPEQFTGVDPERYLRVDLEAGDNLVVVDVIAQDHGRGLHLGIDGNGPFELLSPIETGPDDSPFITIGPFDVAVYVDHEPHAGVSRQSPEYLAAASVRSRDDLARFGRWLHPIPKSLLSRDNVLALCIWTRSRVAYPVPPALQNAVIANPAPAPVPLYGSKDSEFIVEFGHEVSGYIAFEAEAPAGTVLDFYGFEYMHDEDGWRQNTADLDNTLRYVCREGYQRYVSPVRRGLRYLMVTVRGGGAALDPDSPPSPPSPPSRRPVLFYGIQVVQSTYPVAEVGAFHSSDALLDRVWQISRRTVRLCMEDTFVDCPAYQQTFWVGDSRNEALVDYYVFGAEALVERCLRLVPGSRFQSPLYVDQVPSGWNSVIPNWTFFWVMACHEYYERGGDERFAREMWPHVRYTLDHYLQRLDERGLFAIAAWNLLDWAPIDQPRDGVVTHQNLFLVGALRAAAHLARIAGDAEGSEGYVVAADRLAEAINRDLWSDERMAYIDAIHADGRRSTSVSLQSQVVAYMCDVARGERAARIEHYLLDPPDDFVRIGSPFTSFFYYEALARAGRVDALVDDMRRNYGLMVEHGATTCWEEWPVYAELKDNPGNPNILTRSHCHAWSAAPGYFLGAYVLGMLFFPTIGNGRVWYQTSTLHAQRASHWCVVFDPHDLALVASGRRAQWQVQPRRRWPLRFPGISYPLPGWSNGPEHTVTGVVFDPDARLLFVAVRRPWSVSNPDAGTVVATYEVM